MNWKRSRNEHGTTIYTSGEFTITSYGKGQFGVLRVERPKVALAAESKTNYWAAESLEEAKVAADYLSVGGDPHAHVTRSSSTRHGVPPRGSWRAIHKWRCSCGAKSSGGLDAQGAREGMRDHRIAAMREFVEAQA